MTDIPTLLSNKDAAELRNVNLSRRFAAETRFKYFGMAAVISAVFFLILLMSSIVGKGIPAFTHHYASLPVNLTPYADADAPEKGKYSKAFKKSVKALFPYASGRKPGKMARQLFSASAAIELKNQVIENPDIIDGNLQNSVWLPMGDFADLYAKGLVAESEFETHSNNLQIVTDGKTAIVKSAAQEPFAKLLVNTKIALSGELEKLQRRIDQKKQEVAHRNTALNANADEKLSASLKSEFQKTQNQLEVLIRERVKIEARLGDPIAAEKLDETTPSVLIHVNGGILKVSKISPALLETKILVPFERPQDDGDTLQVDQWKSQFIAAAQNSRKFNDFEVALFEVLRADNRVEKRWNTPFFTNGASREPESAGIFGALVGSLLTMVVTLVLAFPLGVMAAIYLEEFAPKNRLTDAIEVNINNLAAVPSIIFGLLGLAIFLNWFNMPRSAPIVGGMVLALMTLPTIIIASRAALRAVPPSIREAALGIGASKVQSVFHHVLPLAMPGILTGTIIGMAQALGETAPLLMIGMVAFIADVSVGFSDPATVMPVQIYMWADFPEPAFQQKTAAAILILLGVLIAMNAIAVFLRKRFERRW